MAAAFAGAVALAAAAAASSGQPAAPGAADDSLLASLIGEALANNPAVHAAEQSARAARSRPRQAGSLPYPMLSVVYTNDGVAPSLGERDMTTLAFMASQDLPYPGKRGLQSGIEQSDADQVAQQLERVRLDVAAAVRRSYSGLLLARAQLGVVEEQSAVWTQIEGMARSRYTVGQAGQQDVLRAQVELSRIAELRAQQDVEAQIRLAELNRLLARPAEAPLETRAPLRLRVLEEEFPEWFERLRSQSPEVRSAALAVERERLAVKLAGKESRPDFALQAGYMNRGGLEPMWLAGVGVRLPIWRGRAAGAVDEAEARLQAAEHEVESVELLLRLRTQERLAQIRTTEHIAGLYDQSIIPQDRLSVDAAVANYQVGQVPFVTVLETLSTLYSDRSAHLALLAKHAALRADLEEASLEVGP